MNAKLSAALAALALGFPLVAAAEETMPSLVIGADAALNPYEYQSATTVADQVYVDDQSCNAGCSQDAYCADACRIFSAAW